jgi:hypothetical protein
MRVELLYFEGCPSWKVTEERLLVALTRTGHGDVVVRRTKVETLAQAEDLGFVGSPTVLVDGHDSLSRGDEGGPFACRVFQTPGGLAGSPTIEQLSEALA